MKIIILFTDDRDWAKIIDIELRKDEREKNGKRERRKKRNSGAKKAKKILVWGGTMTRTENKNNWTTRGNLWKSSNLVQQTVFYCYKGFFPWFLCVFLLFFYVIIVDIAILVHLSSNRASPSFQLIFIASISQRKRKITSKSTHSI